LGAIEESAGAIERSCLGSVFLQESVVVAFGIYYYCIAVLLAHEMYDCRFITFIIVFMIL
jgi:hypothetical protein